ncbi:MAG: tyrosine--tRNA ligase [Candidatus Marinimicrobia bacterium]|mgnify:FL=1|nr:tyrosine--tRNA ligase [Candidatus Neomarinimicrobiota bacterium]MBT3630532.1 tyrosine--tRNA ligase [Candidatus Neomarinimicrobiota bacterium]MBT3823399.1 tyrosine--tRNA ligase [Candidatus Neomarinimicrobiota bacterium]MBT4131464.1 tyrosine--tRNA ligase [Candidatus Neomarinimicrobiota bacterium]MBT4295819.1 tyrosine--tRNA ligase [Candidatus Neomarinimicrobiota bacterium]
MKFPPVKEQIDVVSRGVEDFVSPEGLEQKLEKSTKSGKPLKIKLGADPSRPDLHIGHAVVLRKLRQFQDLGHQAILIIGDFTASIGDPTGRNKTRPSITLDEARDYGKSYLEQASIILNADRLDVVHNSDWLNSMNFSELIKLAAQVTVAQMLERDDFSQRYKGGTPISVHEFLYPLAQAQDSVYLHSDVELGGTDQLFNLLMGRELQKKSNQAQQIIMTLPLLEGTDGKEKMSKSYDNYIGLSDTPADMFGKVLSIPDEMIVKYLTLTTNLSMGAIQEIDTKMKSGANPRDFKRQLGRELVKVYYDDHAAMAAQEAFDNLFIKKDIPDEMPELTIDSDDETLLSLLDKSGLFASKGEIRRLVKQNAVSVDNKKIQDEFFPFNIKGSFVIKAGKRKFVRINHN